MKSILFVLCLSALLSGCSWLHHGENSERSSTAWGAGPDAQGRGTTGVSSGANAGSGITGSDAAPPR